MLPIEKAIQCKRRRHLKAPRNFNAGNIKIWNGRKCEEKFQQERRKWIKGMKGEDTT